MSEQEHIPRARPVWARAIHNFGDDLRWTCSGWTDFPRPVRRATAAVCAAAGGRFVGADEAITSIVQTIAE